MICASAISLRIEIGFTFGAVINWVGRRDRSTKQLIMEYMKMKQIILRTTVAGFVSMVLMSGAASAETTEMTKPKGAMGTGNVKEGQPKSNQFWWPDQLDLSALRDHDAKSNPYGAEFDYAKAFNRNLMYFFFKLMPVNQHF
ncbi:MAG: hypothetical protein ACJASL_004479 [Paraglaciecola sp.]|jgi:hypothetical protein